MKKLVVLACSKKKIWKEDKTKKFVKAKDVYRSKIFIYGKRYAERHKYPYVILSAKYGIISPGKPIKKYDRKIADKKHAKKISSKYSKKINKLFQKYEQIYMFGGNRLYRFVFENINNKKFRYFRSKKSK